MALLRPAASVSFKLNTLFYL